MAYKDWLNEQASNKNAGMNNIKPADIPAVKKMTPVSGVKAPSTNAGGGNSTPTTNTGATGAENGAGGTTGGSMTYEDWYATNKQHYDDLYQQTLAGIEAKRQKTITDSAAARAKQVGTYGANAERLASMGLTGGGYSDYLTAQAHAAHRGDVQAANALAEQSKLTTKQGYDETMLGLTEQRMQKEQQYQSDKSAILREIEADGFGSMTTISETAKAKGMSDEDISSALGAYEKRVLSGIKTFQYVPTEETNEDGSEKYTLEVMSDEDIDAYVKADQITEETAKRLKQERNNALLEYIQNKSNSIAEMEEYIAGYEKELGKAGVQQANYMANVAQKDNGDPPKNVNDLNNYLDTIMRNVSDEYLTKGDGLAIGAYLLSRMKPKVAKIGNATVDGDTIKGVFGDGTEYTLHLQSATDMDLEQTLNTYMAGKGLDVGSVVIIDGEPYVYKGNEEWWKAAAEATRGKEKYTLSGLPASSGNLYEIPPHQPSEDGYSNYLTS